MTKRTAIVVGVGAEQGLGAALCRRFAAEGYHILAAGRTKEKLAKVVATIQASGGSAEMAVIDATREADVLGLFDRGMSPLDGREPVDLLVWNPGNTERLDFRDLSVETFEDYWRASCLSSFLIGREAARRLAPLGRGTLIFTGASASLRGKPGFAHFAAAKAGARAIAQSMAREYGPMGLHVAHVIIDGVIDGDMLYSRFPDLAKRLGTDGLLAPAAIADAYWHIHSQHPSAWTHEIDLRPFGEQF